MNPRLWPKRADVLAHRARRALPAAAVLLIAACASDQPAPVEDLSEDVAPARSIVAPARTPAVGGTHQVVRGDTLYAIAFRNGLDFRDVAAWNNIAPPYVIYVGQTLRLGPPGI